MADQADIEQEQEPDAETPEQAPVTSEEESSPDFFADFEDDEDEDWNADEDDESDDQYEDGDNAGEYDPEREKRLRAQVETERKRRLKVERKLWVAEARQKFPHAADRLHEIHADNKAGFMKRAKREHERVKKIEARVRSEYEAKQEAAQAKRENEQRAEAESQWDTTPEPPAGARGAEDAELEQALRDGVVNPKVRMEDFAGQLLAATPGLAKVFGLRKREGT